MFTETEMARAYREVQVRDSYGDVCGGYTVFRCDAPPRGRITPEFRYSCIHGGHGPEMGGKCVSEDSTCCMRIA